MKKLIYILTITSISLNAQAKIWRVNNNPGVTADFSSAQAAHEAANAGDIIHLEPSNTDYGGVIANKPLTWLSVGHFLAENPGLQYAPNTGKLNFIQFSSGSAGSVFSAYCLQNIHIETSNITVERAFAASGVFITNGPNNIIIRQSYFNAPVTLNGNNVVFTNNICRYITVDAPYSAVITNNVFTYTSGNGLANIANSVFQNNIIMGTSFTYNFTTPVNVSYNITASPGGIPTGNSNIFSVDMSSVFVNPGEASSRADKDFILKAGSPAAGAGLDGADMGAFGGVSPFVLGLQPAIPAVTGLAAPGATSAGSMQVIISAKTNQ